MKYKSTEVIKGRKFPGKDEAFLHPYDLVTIGHIDGDGKIFDTPGVRLEKEDETSVWIMLEVFEKFFKEDGE